MGPISYTLTRRDGLRKEITPSKTAQTDNEKSRAPLLQCHAFYPRDTKTQRHRVAMRRGKQQFLAGEKNSHKASTSGHLVREKIHKSHC